MWMDPKWFNSQLTLSGLNILPFVFSGYYIVSNLIYVANCMKMKKKLNLGNMHLFVPPSLPRPDPQLESLKRKQMNFICAVMLLLMFWNRRWRVIRMRFRSSRTSTSLWNRTISSATRTGLTAVSVELPTSSQVQHASKIYNRPPTKLCEGDIFSRVTGGPWYD